MDIAEIDDEGRGKLFFGNAEVLNCVKVKGQKDIFELTVKIVLQHKSQSLPLAGQFYLLKSLPSSVQLDRPISVYSYKYEELSSGKRELELHFLILQKGQGTQELCSLRTGDTVEAIGPLGNAFVPPSKIEKGKRICIIGGGIGVAPVACFASSLANASYDFYASFKSLSYGLENINPASLIITSDDGSVGTKGMLPIVFNKESIKDKNYSTIYACGPIPMLSYVQQVAKECNIECYLSMENRMACGVGACLGCTIRTTEGVKRVCKDGPIFNANILDFSPFTAHKKVQALKSEQDVNLSVDIAGIHFENPVIAASGTFGFGQNYRGLFDVNALGGIASKGCTLEAREGNSGLRIVETPSGNINSIGLQNPGLKAFIKEELPEMLKLKPVIIANLAGSDLDSYIEGARLLDKSDVPMIELNISCPNVKSGGQAWGIKSSLAEQCVKAVRSATSKPLIIKLSPNSPELIQVALSCIEAGADALSLINTIQAVSIDIERGGPAFDNIRAGLCGPAIKPIALRMVYDVVEAINKLPIEKRVPVIGIGGIATWQDAAEFIMAGAHAIQVGSATFSNPLAMLNIIDGLRSFMCSHGYESLEQMRGIAQR